MRREPAWAFEHPDVPEGHDVRPHIAFRLSAADWRSGRSSTTDW